MAIRWVCMTFLLGALAVIARAAEPTSRLEPARLIAPSVHERPITNGQFVPYRLHLREGEAVELRPRRNGIYVFIHVKSPDGTTLVDGQNLYRDFTAKPVVIIAPSSGDHEIEVEGYGVEGAAGSFVLEVSAVAPSEEVDWRRFAQQTLAASAARAQQEDDVAQSIRYSEAALAAALELGDCTRGAEAEYRTALAYSMAGRMEDASRMMFRALDSARTSGNREIEAPVLVVLAEIQSALGAHQRALALFDEARSTAERNQDPYHHAQALNSSAVLYSKLDDYHRARAQYELVLPIWRSLRERSWEAVSLNNLAKTHERDNELAVALSHYEKSVRIFEELGSPLLSRALQNVGGIRLQLGQAQEARRAYLQALEIARNAGSQVWTLYSLVGLGAAAARAGDHETALSLQSEALAISRGTLQDPHAEMEVLYRRAESLAQLGRPDDAEREVTAAIELLEENRASVEADRRRAAYFASKRAYYELLITLQLQGREGAPARIDRALEASERSRARVLAERLAEGRVDFEAGADPRLLKRERDLAAGIRAMRAAERRDAAALARQVADLEDVRAEIRVRSPRFAVMTRPPALTAASLQAQLERDTVALEYFIGAEKAWVWTITRDSIAVHELLDRAGIATAVETLAAAIGWRSDSRGLTRVAPAGPPSNDGVVVRAAETLGRLIVPPVLPAATKMIVIADSPLHGVPFSLLTDSSGRRLFDTRTISVAPSLSSIIALREVAGARRSGERVLVVADPLFSQRADGARRPQAATLREAGIFTTGDRVAPLPFSAIEAAAIARTIEGDKLDLLTGQSATLPNLTNRDLRSYRLIHFATHAVVDPAHPELSGLLLSNVTPDGARVDGFLPLHEIYRLELNADLVVLSACSTAGARDLPSEGADSLARAFLQAGSRRVVASLWNVTDASTAALMRTFYREMAAGRSADAALRAAQVAVQREPRWSSPFYWAGFIVVGEWQ